MRNVQVRTSKRDRAQTLNRDDSCPDTFMRWSAAHDRLQSGIECFSLSEALEDILPVARVDVENQNSAQRCVRASNLRQYRRFRVTMPRYS